MKKTLKKASIGMGVFLLPAVAFAQSLQNTTNATSLFANVRSILNAVVPIIIALGVVYILWGIIQSYTRGDEEKRKEGHMKVLYGIIALFVMVSIWGLVNILVGTAGLSNNIPANGNASVPNLNNINNGNY